MMRTDKMWSGTIWGGALALVALAGCSAPKDTAPDPVALVRLAPATSGELANTVAVSGAVEPGVGSERTLSAPTEAVVSQIMAPAGSDVRPGTVVVQLVASPQSALDRAKATSDAAVADSALARAQRLQRDGLVGNAEVETARATAQGADATLANLRGRAGALTMTTAVAGVVSAVLVKPGDLVAAGAPIARIASGGATRARFGIDPTLAQGLTRGGSIQVAVVDGPTVTVPITGVDRVVDPTTRLASVFANLPAGLGFAVGEPLSGTLSHATGEHGTVIPYSAIQDDGGVPYVYVVAGDKAHRREVKLGIQSTDRVIVLDGLNPGEQVVIEGGTAVDDGMAIRTGPMPGNDKSDTGKDAG